MGSPIWPDWPPLPWWKASEAREPDPGAKNETAPAGRARAGARGIIGPRPARFYPSPRVHRTVILSVMTATAARSPKGS